MKKSNTNPEPTEAEKGFSEEIPAEKDENPSPEPRISEEEPLLSPKEMIAELESIFSNLQANEERLQALEALKLKYQEELSNFHIDPLAGDAERRNSIRNSRLQMIDMVDADIYNLQVSEAHVPRVRFLLNELQNVIRKAIGRDLPTFCDEVRQICRTSPAASALFDGQEPSDFVIMNLPIKFRIDRLHSRVDSFVGHWRGYSAARMLEEFQRFMKIAKKAAAGERLVALPELA